MASLCREVVETIVEDLAFSDIVKLSHICRNLRMICQFIIQRRVWLGLADIVGKKHVKTIYNAMDCLQVVLSGTFPLKVLDPGRFATAATLLVVVVPNGTLSAFMRLMAATPYHHWFVQKIHESEQASITRYLILRNTSTSLDRFLVRFFFLLVHKGPVVKDFLSPIRQRIPIPTRSMSSKACIPILSILFSTPTSLL